MVALPALRPHLSRAGKTNREKTGYDKSEHALAGAFIRIVLSIGAIASILSQRTRRDRQPPEPLRHRLRSHPRGLASRIG